MKNLFLKAIRLLMKSLKIRLFVIIFLVGIAPSVVLCSAILNSYEDRAVSVRVSDVSNQLKIIANHLITYHYLENNTGEVIDAELNQLTNLYDGRMLVINGDLKVVRDTYGISQGKTIISEEVIKCLKGEASISNYDANNRYIEFTTPITETVPDEETGEPVERIRGVLLTSVSTDTIAQTTEILNRRAILVESIMLIVVFALALVLALLLVHPFDKLTGAISQVKEGFTNEPIMIREYRETQHICDAFNTLQNRMKVLDDSRNEFVSNVSHELKTPITSIKILADSLLMQGDAPAELYREFLEDISGEIDREDRIINDLLSLVKLDKTIAELNVTKVDINLLVENVLKRLRPIAMKQDVDLVFESIRPVVATVDEVKISQVITNLVENAIKYNREHDGWVKVTLDADHQYFMLDVADSGIGIPEESQDHIFERFYRVDKSHSREIGGTGLGLAITRSAVLMHRGSIKVSSAEGQGTVFSVRIPLTYIAG